MSTFHRANNPGQQYERQYAKQQEYRRYAEEAEAEGKPRLAAHWRRRAAGVAAALTRLARNEGWL